MSGFRSRGVLDVLLYTSLTFLLSIPCHSQLIVPDESCRGDGEVRLGVDARVRGAWEYFPNLISSLGATASASPPSPGYNVSTLVDQDRCCIASNGSLSYLCGVQFVPLSGSSHATVYLPQNVSANQILTSWEEPCSGVPKPGYTLSLLNASGIWQEFYTRDTGIDPCLALQSDRSKGAMCIDFFPHVVSHAFRLSFDNNANGFDGGHILEFEVHGLTLDIPRGLGASPQIIGPLNASATVLLPPVVVDTRNILQDPLGSIDVMTTGVTVAIQGPGSPTGSVFTLPSNMTVDEGIATLKDWALNSPRIGIHTITISSTVLTPVSVQVHISPGTPVAMRPRGSWAPMGTAVPTTSLQAIRSIETVSYALIAPDIEIELWDAGSNLTPQSHMNSLNLTAIDTGLTRLSGTTMYNTTLGVATIDTTALISPDWGDHYIQVDPQLPGVDGFMMLVSVVRGPAVALKVISPSYSLFLSAEELVFPVFEVHAIDESGETAAPHSVPVTPVMAGGTIESRRFGLTAGVMLNSVVKMAGIGITRPKAGMPYSITFSAPGLTPATFVYTILPGSPAYIEIASATASTLGVLISSAETAVPVTTLRLTDAGRNVLTSSNSQPPISITIAIRNVVLDEPAKLSANVTIEQTVSANNYAVFDDVVLTYPPSGDYDVSFSSDVVVGVSTAFQVIPGNASAVRYDPTSFSQVVLQSDFNLKLPSLALFVEDVSGNRVTTQPAIPAFARVIPQQSNVIDTTASSGSGSRQLLGYHEAMFAMTRGDPGRILSRAMYGQEESLLQAGAGSDIVLEKEVDIVPDTTDTLVSVTLPRITTGKYQLEVIAPPLLPISVPFTIIPGDPELFRFRVKPPTTDKGLSQPLLQQPVLEVTDSLSNLVSSAGNVIVSVDAEPYATMTGSLQTSVAGVIAFSSLAIDGVPNTDYSLTFRAQNYDVAIFWSPLRILSCQKSVLGSVYDPTTRKCVCPPGTFSDTLTSCAPCGLGFWSSSTNAAACNRCPDDMDTGNVTQSTSLSYCSCSAGFFTPVIDIQADTPALSGPNATVGTSTAGAGPSCVQCPDGAVCTGGSAIEAKPGFWRADANSLTFHECHRPEMCPGGETECDARYSGTRCLTCAENHAKVGDICEECWEGISAWVPLLAQWLLLFCVSQLLIYSATSGYRSTVLIQSLQYLQLVAFISQLRFTWAPLAVKILSVFEGLMLMPFHSYPTNCVLDVDFYTKLFFTYMIPPISMGGTFLGAVGYAVWLRYNDLYFDREKVKKIVLRAFLRLSMYCGPVVARTAVEPLFCVPVGDGGGESAVWSDLRVTCGTVWHGRFTLGSFVILGVSLVGFPLLLAFLFRPRRDYDDEGFAIEQSAFEELRRSVAKPFIDQFPNRVWSWSIVIYFRQLVFVPVVVWLSQESQLQHHVGAWILFIFLFTTMMTRPYLEATLGHLESVQMLCLYLVVIIGLTGFSPMKGNQTTAVLIEEGSTVSLALGVLSITILFFPIVLAVVLAKLNATTKIDEDQMVENNISSLVNTLQFSLDDVLSSNDIALDLEGPKTKRRTAALIDERNREMMETIANAIR